MVLNICEGIFKDNARMECNLCSVSTVYETSRFLKLIFHRQQGYTVFIFRLLHSGFICYDTDVHF